MVSPRRTADIPVIAYDRFIEGADYYMSFDNETVGELQAQALVDAMGGKGDIIDAQRRPDRPERRAVQGGRAQRPRQQRPEDRRRSTTTRTGARRTPRSSSPTSSASIDADDIDGVYAANDGQAGGVDRGAHR